MGEDYPLYSMTHCRYETLKDIMSGQEWGEWVLLERKRLVLQRCIWGRKSFIKQTRRRKIDGPLDLRARLSSAGYTKPEKGTKKTGNGCKKKLKELKGLSEDRSPLGGAVTSSRGARLLLCSFTGGIDSPQTVPGSKVNVDDYKWITADDFSH